MAVRPAGVEGRVRDGSRGVTAGLGVALGVALVAACALPSGAEERLRSISVSGSGQVQAAPDAAYLDAGATREAVQAKAAIAANSEAMRALLDALKEAGIESRDTQTHQLELSPQYAQGSGTRRAVITGYRATSRVRVRVRDIDRVGRVLDALVEAGANELGSISFTVLEPDPLFDRARIAALADARRKATLLAREAGVALGPVLEIRDGAVPTPFSRGRGAFAGEATMAAQSVPVATGELEFSAQVSVVYALVESAD